MLVTLEVKLGLPHNVTINQSIGSVMHGALMDMVGPITAEKLHQEGLRPFSQYIYYDKNRSAYFWRISSLNKATFDAVLEPVLQHGEDLFLKQKWYAVCLMEKKIVSQTSYEKMADEVFLSDELYAGCEIGFLTSAGFKSEDHYVIFPQTNLLFQSLINRWNGFSSALKLDDEKAFQHLGEHSYISRYDLRMMPFHVGGGKIPAFNGRLEMRFTGNQTMRRLMALLMKYANYSGVGIKTALGMGGVAAELLVGKRSDKTVD